MEKEDNIQVQKAQRSPTKFNLKKNSPRHIIIELLKIKGKERKLKATRKKNNIRFN